MLNNLCSQVKHGLYKICNGLGWLRPYLKLFESGVDAGQTILNAKDKCSHFILAIADMACFFDLIWVRMRKGRQAFKPDDLKRHRQIFFLFVLAIADMACFFDLILVRMRKGRQAFISRILDNKPRACFTRNRSNSG